ncbi:hypothetical protein AB6N24_00350 [Cellulomonas sp. 179-A 4D5 NHS]
MLAQFDDDGTDHAVVGTPDPLIIGPAQVVPGAADEGARPFPTP